MHRNARRLGALPFTSNAVHCRLGFSIAGRFASIVSYDLKTYNHIVRDAAGREWTIKAPQNLDAGSEYMLGGRWLPEDHPLVMAELRRTRTNS